MGKQTEKSSAVSEAALVKGVTKAAILLLSLNNDSAAAVLQHLEEEVVEEITREIAQLDLIEPQQRGNVIEEFYNLALARQYLKQGGMVHARQLLEKALSPERAAELLKRLLPG